MHFDRRHLLALSAALPLLGERASVAAPAPPAREPADAALLWRNLFAGRPGKTYAWWLQGTMFAHVDRLREFPVAGVHAIMICRTQTIGSGLAVDFRTIGLYTDPDSGKPATSWRNIFTDRTETVPGWFVEGPGRYTMQPGTAEPAMRLTADRVRTNRLVAMGEAAGERAMLDQIEATLQGFPQIDGRLPPVDSPQVTERQTRFQIFAPRAAALGAVPLVDAHGYFTQVYDALPAWLGFGETLGSGLYKGKMRKADAGTALDADVWAHLKHHVPDAFAGDRLVLP